MRRKIIEESYMKFLKNVLLENNSIIQFLLDQISHTLLAEVFFNTRDEFMVNGGSRTSSFGFHPRNLKITLCISTLPKHPLNIS